MPIIHSPKAESVYWNSHSNPPLSFWKFCGDWYTHTLLESSGKGHTLIYFTILSNITCIRQSAWYSLLHTLHQEKGSGSIFSCWLASGVVLECVHCTTQPEVWEFRGIWTLVPAHVLCYELVHCTTQLEAWKFRGVSDVGFSSCAVPTYYHLSILIAVTGSWKLTQNWA